MTDWRWRLLGAATLVQAGLSVAELGLPLLVGFFKADFHTSTTVAGLVVSSYYGGKFLGSYFAGRISDHVGEVVVITTGASVAATILICAAFLPLAALVPVLALAGLAGAGSTPAGGRLVWQTFPPNRRGLALGIRQTGVPLGGVLASCTLPAIAHATSWRTSVVSASVVALASVVPLFALRRHGRLEPPARIETARRPINSDVRWLTVWGCLAMTGQFVVLTYLPLDAHARAHMSLPTAGLLAAAAQASGIAGRIAWGLVSDRSPGRGRRSLLLVLTLSSAAAVAIVFALPRESPLAVWLVAAALLGMTAIGFQGLWLTMLTEVSDPQSVGAATGFAVMCTIGSVTATPVLFGAFADWLGTYRSVWLLLVAVLGVSLFPISRLQRAAVRASAGVGTGVRPVP